MFDDGKMWFRDGKRRFLGLMRVLGYGGGNIGFGDLRLRKICVLRMLKKTRSGECEKHGFRIRKTKKNFGFGF